MEAKSQINPKTILRILKHPKRMRKFAQAAFDEVDLDGSGEIERPEFRIVMINVAQDIDIQPQPKDAEIDEL